MRNSFKRAGIKASERHPYLISQIKASVFLSARLAMVPGTPCILANSKHPKFNSCVGTLEASLVPTSFALSHGKRFSAQSRTLLRAHPLPGTISWCTVHVYWYTCRMCRYSQKTDPVSWKSRTARFSTQSARGKTSFCLIQKASFVVISDVKFYDLFLACWMIVGKIDGQVEPRPALAG